MSWDAWIFSARLAWGNLSLRWTSIAVAILTVGASILFIASVLPSAISQHGFAFRYNVYFGINEVQEWPWVFFLPMIWLVITAIDLIVLYGYYRTDPVLSKTLLALSLAWAFPWMSLLFYLTIINS